MRFIRKLPEPEVLVAFRARLPDWKAELDDLPENKKASWLWKKFTDSTAKSKVHARLLEEQGHLCAYCSRLISLKNSHIDHVVPQSTDRARQFAYDNLVASCYKEQPPVVSRHCGHLKGNKALVVSPLQGGCDGHFEFLESGVVRPSPGNDIAVINQIDNILGLNIAHLKALRKAAIGNLLDMGPRARGRAPLTLAELQKLITHLEGEEQTFEATKVIAPRTLREYLPALLSVTRHHCAGMSSA